MKINMTVLLSILSFSILIIAATFYFFDFNIFFNFIVSCIVGVASAKIYKSLCNYEGKLYYKMNGNQDPK